MKQFVFFLTAFTLYMPYVFTPLGLLQKILHLIKFNILRSDMSKLNGWVY